MLEKRVEKTKSETGRGRICKKILLKTSVRKLVLVRALSQLEETASLDPWGSIYSYIWLAPGEIGGSNLHVWAASTLVAPTSHVWALKVLSISSLGPTSRKRRGGEGVRNYSVDLHNFCLRSGPADK